MKLQKLAFLNENKKNHYYFHLRKFKTIKNIMTYPYINKDIKRFKNKKYNEIFVLINVLQTDNVNQLLEYFPELYKDILYNIFSNAFYKNEVKINDCIESIYGIRIPKIVHYALSEAIKSNLITHGIYKDEIIYVATLKGLFKIYPNKKHLNILSMLLNGYTVKEIGTKYNISRQRISQLLINFFHKNIYLEEYKYYNLFSQYKIKYMDFLAIYNLENNQDNIQAYNYLDLIAKHNKIKNNRKPLTEIFKDKEITDITLKKNLLNYLQKNYISFNDNKINPTNNSILQFVIKTLFINDNSLVNIRTIVNKYKEIVSLNKDIKPYASRVILNKLLNNNNFLSSPNGYFRTYNFNCINFESLYSLLFLDKYNNLEISTQIFVDKNPTILSTLRLKNIYELHNLLKKKYLENKNIDKHILHINFKRMPHLVINNGNIQKQINNIKKENQNASNSTIAKIMRQKYGIREVTVINHL